MGLDHGKQFTYVIKDWTGDEFDNVFRPSHEWRLYNDHESVAEDLAEQRFWEDPCDPNKFELTIGVKDGSGCIKWFSITAQPEVSFHAKETPNDPR